MRSLLRACPTACVLCSRARSDQVRQTCSFTCVLCWLRLPCVWLSCLLCCVCHAPPCILHPRTSARESPVIRPPQDLNPLTLQQNPNTTHSPAPPCHRSNVLRMKCCVYAWTQVIMLPFLSIFMAQTTSHQAASPLFHHTHCQTFSFPNPQSPSAHDQKARAHDTSRQTPSPPN